MDAVMPADQNQSDEQLNQKTRGTRGTSGTPSDSEGGDGATENEPCGTCGTIHNNFSCENEGLIYTADDNNKWLSSPMQVKAITHDEDERNFGRLLRFRNTVGNWREWAMPMELLSGSGEDIRRELLDMGVNLSPVAEERRLLLIYLQLANPPETIQCTDKTGWFDRCNFVLPDECIGKRGIKYQSSTKHSNAHKTSGSLDDWRHAIAAKALGNPYLIASLSAPFAGPLLSLLDMDSGGIHFTGASSMGKSTLIRASCSVWGSPDYKRSWNATANGMEGVAALYNDCLLALDEIGECNQRDVGAIVYALGNGVGKARANRTGGARAVRKWTCFVLSNGESSIEQVIQSSGQRYNAGQAIRLLDIPVIATYGAYDELHGAANGAVFSDDLNSASAKYYGEPGREFIRKLLSMESDLTERLSEIESGLIAVDATGQERRAAKRLAIMALAGELASDFGVTGWRSGTAISAAQTMYSAWRKHRGKGDHESNKIIEALSDFVERYQLTHFAPMKADGKQFSSFAGLYGYRDNDDSAHLYFNGNGLKIALGISARTDFSPALRRLEDHGVVIRNSPKDCRHSKYIAATNNKEKLYKIRLASLEVPQVPHDELHPAPNEPAETLGVPPVPPVPREETGRAL